MLTHTQEIVDPVVEKVPLINLRHTHSLSFHVQMIQRMKTELMCVLLFVVVVVVVVVVFLSLDIRKLLVQCS